MSSSDTTDGARSQRFGAVDQEHRARPRSRQIADEYVILGNGGQDEAVDTLAEQLLDK